MGTPNMCTDYGRVQRTADNISDNSTYEMARKKPFDKPMHKNTQRIVTRSRPTSDHA
jgi:hypothetical protein